MLQLQAQCFLLDKYKEYIMEKNVINIFLKKENIILRIKDNATKAQITEELRQKLPELKKFYKEEQTPILVTGKILKTNEIDEIQAQIEKEMKVKVNFDSPRTMGLHGIIKDFRKEIATSETKFYKGSLRSGQRMEVEGSLVILGDVNSGAEVMATDNIVVLGALRGLAHAGAKGNKGAMISAGRLDTAQMRIANIVKEFNREEELLHKMAYAYIDGDKIIVE
jgi:septum site-determining protein MinC